MWEALVSSQSEDHMNTTDDSDLDLDGWDYDDDSDSDKSHVSRSDKSDILQRSQDNDLLGNNAFDLTRTMTQALGSAAGTAGERRRSIASRKLGNLPTFASVDDYAALLDKEPDS